MPDVFYNSAKDRLGGGVTVWTTAALKVLLVNATYSPVNTDVFVSTAVASSAEIVATNYTGGFAGAGRKTLGTKSHAVVQGSNRAELYGILPTWTALGGGTNATIVGAVLFEEITSDAGSPLIAYFALTSTLTNGGDFTVAWATNLLLTLT